MAAPAPERLLSVAVQAATEASDAAQAPREFAKRSEASGRQKFSKASKVTKPPDAFGSENRDEDQKQWHDFILNFKSLLFLLTFDLKGELTYVENNAKAVVSLSGMSEEAKARPMQLYSFSTGYLRGSALRLLRQQDDRKGMEVYRQLIQQLQPSSKARSLSLLQAFTQAPAFSKDKPLLEQVLRLRTDYQRSSGETLKHDLALSALVRCLPTHVRQHVRLQMSDSTTH